MLKFFRPQRPIPYSEPETEANEKAMGEPGVRKGNGVYFIPYFLSL